MFLHNAIKHSIYDNLVEQGVKDTPQNSWRRTVVTPPPVLPGIYREQSLKILGVTITRHLSASGHPHKVISDSAQSLYALRVQCGTTE